MSEIMRPMSEAPRDGTFILALDTDFSGASLIAHAAATEEFTAQWLGICSDPICDATPEDEKYFLGWITAPLIPAGIAAMAAREALENQKRRRARWETKDDPQPDEEGEQP